MQLVDSSGHVLATPSNPNHAKTAFNDCTYGATARFLPDDPRGETSRRVGRRWAAGSSCSRLRRWSRPSGSRSSLTGCEIRAIFASCSGLWSPCWAQPGQLRPRDRGRSSVGPGQQPRQPIPGASGMAETADTERLRQRHPGRRPGRARQRSAACAGDLGGADSARLHRGCADDADLLRLDREPGGPPARPAGRDRQRRCRRHSTHRQASTRASRSSRP